MKPPLWEQMLEPDKVWCDCGVEVVIHEAHTCPYQEEINGDSELCNCCPACRANCQEEI